MSAASVITPNEPFAPRAANDNELGDTYDAPGQLIHVHDRAANKRTNYIHAGGQMIARLEKTHGQAPVARYQYTDLLGSPVAGHRDDGTLWRERYTPYGEKMLKPVELDNFVGGRQSRIFCPVDRKYPKKARKGASFTGHIDDTATGLTSAFFVKRKLHDMQARYYDPNIGRFLSVDPVGFMDTGLPSYFNRYSYTANDPINKIDPDGRCHSDICRDAKSREIGKVVEKVSVAIQGKTEAGSKIHEGAKAAAAVGSALVAINGGRKSKGKPNTNAGDASDSTPVCHGGTCSAESFENGTGVTSNADGTLNGISTQSRAGATAAELSKPFKNNQVGATTVGEIKKLEER